MIKDEFKLSKLNLLLIILDIFLVIFTIIIAINMIHSFNDADTDIPDLRTTAGKSSTKAADLTKTTTADIIQTTTKKQGNENSPYYDLNIDELFNNELYSDNSSTLSKSKQVEIVEGYFKILCALYDVTDDNVINTSFLLEHVKSGETDAITANNHRYGIVYNGSTFLNKLFTRVNATNTHTNLTLDGVPVLIQSNGNYYKLENTIGDVNFDVTSYTITEAMSANRIHGKILYYDQNYKAKGLKSPKYESATLTLEFDTTDNIWKVYQFTFPGLEEE